MIGLYLAVIPAQAGIQFDWGSDGINLRIIFR